MENRTGFFRLSLLVAIALLAAAQPVAADPNLPPYSRNETLDNTAARIGDRLSSLDLEVLEGYFQMWGAEECLPTYELVGTCFFNNPAAPYILPVMPYWDDEFVDLAVEGVFGQTREGYGSTYRLDPHEALVIFGYLPPPAHYFGLQSYTFTRKGAYDIENNTYAFLSAIHAQDVFFHEVPLDPKRIFVVNSLSDSINNVTVERQSGASWEEFRYFIISPDGHMAREIRKVLIELGATDSEIFTEAIPKNVRLGLQKNADNFISPLRYAMPLDGGGPGMPSDQWRHSPTLRLLRVRDPSPGYRKEPFPAWSPDSPEARTAVPEGYLQPDLTKLVYAVAQAWGQGCADATCSGRYNLFRDTQSAPFNLVGPMCAEIGMDCQADAQDASYAFCGGITFDNDEVWAAIGTLGTQTGNATYVGLGVNNFRLRLGAKNVEYTALKGSAASYPGVENLDRFFVYYFTRDCDGLETLTHGYCVEVEATDLVIPVGVRATLTERDYIAPGTQRGPDSAQLLPSRALKLTRPVPPPQP